ncbi:MAG: fumarylacetoacetate hydrolase family protein, partial [Candidatus Zixiibacteriota bacterium]
LEIETYLNMELKQRASTADMLHSPAELLSYISGIMTLEPGDVVLTGTPAGVGPLNDGDQLEVRIQNIGSLVNDTRRAV